MKIKLTVLFLFAGFQLSAGNDISDFDQQRPDNISDQKWATLRTAVLEAKLLPKPIGLANEDANFGQSVALDGDRALIGAPDTQLNNNRSGVVYVLEYNGSDWIEKDVLKPELHVQAYKFGSSVSLDGNRALIGSSSSSAYIFDYSSEIWSLTSKLVIDVSFSNLIPVDLLGDRALIGAYRGDGVEVNSGVAYVYELGDGIWSETAKLMASDGSEDDLFGLSVSLSDERILIGASRDDDISDASGSAYIFEYSNSIWSETAKLTASDAANPTGGARFGSSVSLSGERALIGAWGDDDAVLVNTGSAYVFEYTGSDWIETAKLTASDGGASDWFGYSVSLSGDRVLIGAYRNSGDGSILGSAYVYEYDGNNWPETAKLTARDGETFDSFGKSVSLSGDRILIGAEDDDDVVSDAGSAYVFDFNENNWTETIKLTALEGAQHDRFGASISLSGDRALIGVEGDDDNGSFSGSAYVFDFSNGNWSEMVKLTASDGDSADGFGGSVSVFGDRALIGASGDDDNGSFSGSAYVFDLIGNSWSETAKLTASDAAQSGRFGHSVSLLSDRALIGAYNGGSGNSGAAYVFELMHGAWSESDMLTAIDGAAGDLFGHSVSLDEDRALVGAYSEDDDFNNLGSAYVFDFFDGNWSETAKLKASDSGLNQQFGYSVSLLGNRALIGTLRNNSKIEYIGSAYVFDFIEGSWSETAKLLPSDVGNYKSFGRSVSLSENRAVIGAESSEVNDITSGSVYIYELSGASWIETEKLSASDPEGGDRFGSAVSTSGDRVLIGIPFDDDHGYDSGSALIYNTEFGLIFSNGFDLQQ